MTTITTEDDFLGQRIGKPVAIFLINGLRLLGVLKATDSRTVLLKPLDPRDSETELIMKSAISTVVSMPMTTNARPSTRTSSDPLDGILRHAD